MEADRITGLLRDEAAVFDAIEPLVEDVNERRSIVKQAVDPAGRWRGLERSEKRWILQSLVARIELGRESVNIQMQPGRIPELVDPGGEAMRTGQLGFARWAGSVASLCLPPAIVGARRGLIP